VLYYLGKKMKHGMIIAFDDYFVYDTQNISGNRGAFLEFMAQDKRFNFLPYQHFNWNGMSFIVEDAAQVALHSNPAG